MKQIQIDPDFHLSLILMSKNPFFHVELFFLSTTFNFSHFYHGTIIRTYYTSLL